MTNKELINILLDYPMESPVTLRLEIEDVGQFDYDGFEVETERYRQNDMPVITISTTGKELEEVIDNG